MSQESIAVYQVFYNDMMDISNSTVFIFILQPLLDDLRNATVSVNITAISRCIHGVKLDNDSDIEPINGNDVHVHNIAHILCIHMIGLSVCLLSLITVKHF